jgi:nicotinate-nucleotide pyrophosphorylase (carboxylating)
VASMARRISAERTAQLTAAGLDPAAVQRVIEVALAEDLPGGVDVTTVACVPADHRSQVDLVARESGVLAGGPVAAAVFDLVAEGRCAVELPLPDASRVEAGTIVLSVSGPTRDILTAERTALNLLGHLCGVATATALWAAALAGTSARVRDTRKTMPGLRALEKYAVRCGGGVNHRSGLSDAALIKDNHVAAAGGVVPALDAVRRRWPDLPLEVEVDSLEQLREVLAAGATAVLLDNFSTGQLREAVAITAGRAVLEASGGLTLAAAADVAATGVDYVAVGALTHSARVLDIGADYRGEA